MIRRPPRSTLFPYTRSSDLLPTPNGVKVSIMLEEIGLPYEPHTIDRSEEHTSELQSRQYLVCRLLLEKKKTSACAPWREMATGTSCRTGRARAGAPCLVSVA